jgi:hypothetical protein
MGTERGSFHCAAVFLFGARSVRELFWKRARDDRPRPACESAVGLHVREFYASYASMLVGRRELVCTSFFLSRVGDAGLIRRVMIGRRRCCLVDRWRDEARPRNAWLTGLAEYRVRWLGMPRGAHVLRSVGGKGGGLGSQQLHTQSGRWPRTKALGAEPRAACVLVEVMCRKACV